MFAQPFHNLLLNKSIYGLHPDLYFDNYKYSPTFAWLMGAFHFLPISVGVVLWNLLNTLVLLLGVWRYLSEDGLDIHKDQADKKCWLAMLIIFPEALITAQNLQSNNLIVGAMLLGLYHLRNERVWQAAFFFVLCGFIKFYGMAAAIFFLFYPKKFQFLLAMSVWTLLFALAPLTIIPPDSLLSEYQEWMKVLLVSKLKQQVSVMGILQSWFGLSISFEAVEAVGLLLFLLPLLRFRLWCNRLYQQRMVAYFLLFIIVFNKMAESPTYVMAITGVALWWVTLKERSRLDLGLLALAVIFTSLSPTDLFPKFIQKEFLMPYNIKALPCVMIWLRVQCQIWQQPNSNLKSNGLVKPQDQNLLPVAG